MGDGKANTNTQVQFQCFTLETDTFWSILFRFPPRRR